MVPAQVWTTDWGQVATGRFGKAGEPVAFPRALRSQAGGAPSTIRRAPPRPCWTVRRTRGARQGSPLIGLDPDAQHVLNSPSTAAPTAMWPLRSGRLGGRRGP